jgi:hypothetical protein
MLKGSTILSRRRLMMRRSVPEHRAVRFSHTLRLEQEFYSLKIEVKPY